MLGHVNHARALALLEDARLAIAQGPPGGGMILARLEVDYLRQLYYRVSEPLCVFSWVVRLGTKSLTLRQELVQDDQVAIRADCVMVMFDYDTDASRALTEDERAQWTTYLDS